MFGLNYSKLNNNNNNKWNRCWYLPVVDWSWVCSTFWISSEFSPITCERKRKEKKTTTNETCIKNRCDNNNNNNNKRVCIRAKGTKNLGMLLFGCCMKEGNIPFVFCLASSNPACLFCLTTTASNRASSTRDRLRAGYPFWKKERKRKWNFWQKISFRYKNFQLLNLFP